MTAYHLCEQSDGRIVLDREINGELVQTIEVDDPPLAWGWNRDDSVWTLEQRPAWHVTYRLARAQVKDADYEHVPGEGWFRREDEDA